MKVFSGCLVLVVVLATVNGQKFPDNFLLGFATASYQVEGAWNEDGKGENTWDKFTHETPQAIDDGSNGDIATDEYHKYLEDISILKSLGAQVYRFSLSWSRILPNGLAYNINPKGIDYYNRLINALLDNGIQPMVTLFHWDLPQRLQDLGGWPNPLFSDYYEVYAKVAFEAFGDRVKYWITFNEPFETCYSSYGISEKAPGLNMSGIADYLCAHTIIHSHARAYHLYNSTYKALQKGIIGITLNGGWNEPASDDPSDVEAAATSNSFQIGWFAHPIFSTAGDYPPIMRKNVDANSAAEGWSRSRLPQWDEATIDYIRGTYDFYGLNHYTSWYATPQDAVQGPSPSWDKDRAVNTYQDPSWATSASSWLKVTPFGMRRILNYIKTEFNNPTIIITENGYSDLGTLQDDDRINYYSTYLKEVLNAMNEDKVNVIGYTAWSLLDNFEWARGYKERFGIVRVDFDNVNRTRTEKKSAGWFRQLLSTRTLQ